jgi:hypothetical protein
MQGTDMQARTPVIVVTFPSLPDRFAALASSYCTLAEKNMALHLLQRITPTTEKTHG